MKAERLSSINRISGGAEEQRKKIAENFEEEFLQEKWYENEEREKTLEEKEMIETVISRLNDFLKEYGAKPLDLKDTHIHILDKSKMPEEVFDYLEKKYTTATGYYQKGRQDVIVLGWRIISPLGLALVISHELIHFISFNSVIVDSTSKRGFTSHRIGLAVQPQKAEILRVGLKYFNELNEAITEELNIRFYSKLGDVPMLSKEHATVMNTRQKHNAPDVAAIRLDKVETPEGHYFKATIKDHSYPDLRKIFNQLIDKIYEKRKNDFTSREDIFKIFATAAMTGQVKELATLIDGTLGVGTFRKIAQSLERQDLGTTTD